MVCWFCQLIGVLFVQDDIVQLMIFRDNWKLAVTSECEKMPKHHIISPSLRSHFWDNETCTILALSSPGSVLGHQLGHSKASYFLLLCTHSRCWVWLHSCWQSQGHCSRCRQNGLGDQVRLMSYFCCCCLWGPGWTPPFLGMKLSWQGDFENQPPLLDSRDTVSWTTYKTQLKLHWSNWGHYWSKWGQHWGWQSVTTWRMKLKLRTASMAQRRTKKRRTCREQNDKLVKKYVDPPKLEKQQDCGEISFLVWLTHQTPALSLKWPQNGVCVPHILKWGKHSFVRWVARDIHWKLISHLYYFPCGKSSCTKHNQFL